MQTIHTSNVQHFQSNLHNFGYSNFMQILTIRTPRYTFSPRIYEIKDF